VVPLIKQAFDEAKDHGQAENVAFALYAYINDIVAKMDLKTTAESVMEANVDNLSIVDDGENHGRTLAEFLNDTDNHGRTLAEFLNDTDNHGRNLAELLDDDENRGRILAELLGENSNKTELEKKIDKIKKDLKEINVDLTKALAVKVVEQWRERFFRQLATKPIKILKNNKETYTVMSPEEVVQTTNFFYNKIFGTEGMTQVVGVINAYNKVDIGCDEALVQRARNLASDRNRPRAFRTLIGGFGDCINYQSKESIALRAFNANNALFKFTVQYNYMVNQAKAGNEMIINEFRRVDIKKGKGHSFAGQVQEYLRAALQLKPESTSVNNVLQQGSIVQKMVQRFGRGVLVMMPQYVGRE
jgi:hypothetical protein